MSVTCLRAVKQEEARFPRVLTVAGAVVADADGVAEEAGCPA